MVMLNLRLNSQENWEQLEGPYGGNVQCLAFSGNMFFAGTQTGGLFKSTDYGTTWFSISQDLPFTEINLLYVNIDRIFMVNREFGMLKSDDWGVTWDTLHIFQKNWNIRGFAYSEGKLFVGIKNIGVYVSSDNGNNWTLKNFGLKSLAINNIHAYGSVVYVATDNGIHQSGNSGDNWGVFKETGTYNFILRNGNNIFIATTSSVMSTTNNGQDWTSASYGSLGTGTIYSLLSLDNYILAGRSTGFYLASFIGNTITKVDSSLTPTRVYTLINDKNFLYAGSSKGIFMSMDYGFKWRDSFKGLNNERVSSMLITDKQYYIGLYDNGLEVSSDKGKTWEDMKLGLVNVKKLLKIGNDLYAVIGKYVRYSNSEGITWEERDLGLEDITTINCIYEHKTKIYLGTNKGVYLTSNKGIKWTKLANELQNENVKDIYIDKNDDIYLAIPDKILFSRDDGKTWQTSYVGPKNFNFTYIHGFGDYILLGSAPQQSYNGDIYISKDQARNWTASGLNLTDQYVAEIKNHNDMIFISLRGVGNADSRGINYSSNMGKSWNEYNQGILNKNIPAIYVHNDEIFAGTIGAGVYKNSIPEAIHVPEPLYPAHKQKNLVLNPFLDFTDIEKANSYVVQLSESAGFVTKELIINDTVPTSEYQIGNAVLKYETTYFWRVAQIQGGRISDWSDIFEFKTEKEMITTTTLISPADNSTDLWVETEFSWGLLETVDDYTIQISDTDDFSNIVFELAITTNNYLIPKGTLDFEKEYFWRVSVKINAVQRDWSDVFSFTTMKLNLAKPILKAVEDNSDGTMISVKLSWGAVQYADSYQLQIAKDEQFSDVIYNETLDETEIELTKAKLDFSTIYYWHVKAKYIENEGEWSDGNNFETVTEVSVKDDNFYNSITLYPNPSNEFLNVRIDNNLFKEHSILIINNLGNIVFEKNILQTDKEFQLKIPENISSGVYYVKIDNIYKKISIIR
jgi:photosystem II stability/assembly factor-like uncharacterized protein